MKYFSIKSILFALIGILSLTACSKFLDRMPYSDISSIGFYDSEQNLEIAAVGLYGTLQPFYQSYYVFAELTSDNGHTVNSASGTGGQFDKFSLNSMNDLLSSSWINAYESILQTHKVLESLPHVEFTNGKKKEQIEGEARFIRALNYFNLVRMFGKVPLVTHVLTQAEARKLVRDEEEDIYALIIDDLQAASLLLPEGYTGNDIGRATKWTALSLLGKVYLTRQQFDKALEPLQTVVQDGPYSLLATYADIFRPDNANHSESIFEIQYEGGPLNMGSRWSFAVHPRALANEMGISSADGLLPHTDLINTFENPSIADEKTSPRYLATIGRMSGRVHINKHYMDHSYQNQSDDNWPLLRLADVMLMYAEALNETSATPPAEAIELVNQIRRRAFGLPISGSDNSRDLSGTFTGDQENFRDALALERRLELAFEGHRWFDLVRTGKYVEVMNEHFETYYNGDFKVEPYHRIFPVPQREIDINPLLKPNNEGY